MSNEVITMVLINRYVTAVIALSPGTGVLMC